METPLFISTLLLSTLYFFDEKWSALGLCLAFATLLRPEGGIATVLVLSLLLLKRCDRPLFILLSYWGALVLPWLLFATWYYGSPLPHSIIGKQSSYHLPPLSALWDFIGYFRYSLVPILTVELATLLFFLFYSLILLGSYRVGRERWQHWFVPLFLMTYWSFFVVSNPLLFSWYVLPLLPFTLLLFGWTLQRGLRLSQGHYLVLALVVWQLWLLWTGHASALRTHHEERLALYKIAASWLNENEDSAAIIAAPEIGLLGYQLPQAYILDTVGLVSPQAIPHENALIWNPDFSSNNVVPLSLIITEQPRYIVSFDIFIRDTLLPAQEFQKNCQQIKSYPTNVFGSEALYIFEQRGE
jgi:hypothetical protein